MVRPGKSGLDRLGIAHPHRERDVVGGAVIPLMLVTSLTETVHGLNTSINNRTRLIASYHAAGMSSDDLLPLYFGLPQPGTHVINPRPPLEPAESRRGCPP